MVCFHTDTQRPTPTVGGKSERNDNFFLSWPLEVKIGSVTGVVIAVFILVCLVCLVVVGLVLYHSKKRKKEFETGKKMHQ